MGIAWRLEAVGIGESESSGIEDDVVIDDEGGGCVRVATIGGATPGFVCEWCPFFDDDGAGITVGRRIPPVTVAGLSVQVVDGSFVDVGTIDGSGRVFTTRSGTSSSNAGTSRRRETSLSE